MSALPPEAEKLLAAAPDEFVAERKRLALELRDAGRSDDAAAVSRLPKPSPVVLAVNRAACARPKAARAAADAAVRIKQTQLSGDPEALRGAIGDLESSLELLADVAVAHVAPRGKRPSDAMRRRVRDLLRNAVADDDARDALARGVLTAETETPGFAPFAGIAPATARGGRGATSDAAAKREENRRERERALRAELAQAERDLNEAERSVHDAERKRAQAERGVTALRTKLERL